MSPRQERTSNALFVFDYSGTLSRAAVEFGEKRHLVRELRRSGLVACGVRGPDDFWESIVNPTWEEGSVTAVGYRKLIERQLGLLARERGNDIDNDAAQEAAGRFVEAYLSASTIEAGWGRLLARLAALPSAAVLIATDHYAEAGAWIVRHLRRLGIDGHRFGEPHAAAGVAVASSADLGALKSSTRFWQAVAGLTAGPEKEAGAVYAAVTVIDDFGRNEVALDSYAANTAAQVRATETEQAVQTAFHCSVRILQFTPRLRTHASWAAEILRIREAIDLSV